MAKYLRETKGKYETPPARHSHKPSALLAAISLILVFAVGATVAYLFASTDSIQNTFTPAKITTEITENIESGVKNDVQVKNTGDTEAYIRVAVVVTWQDEAGNVHPTAPAAGTDYKVTYPGNGWVKHTDGYYYYTSPVAAGSSTGVLLTGCEPVAEKTPEGYHLCVEILASAIQSRPENAIHSAWGVSIQDGKVEAVNGGNA